MLCSILAEWKHHQSASEKNPTLTEPDNPVFPNRNGQGRTYGGFRTAYRRFLEKHEFTAFEINLHSYRHTFATMLLEAGVNPRIVQRLLGHKDIMTTLNTYSHVLAEVYQGVADKLDAICLDTTNGTFTPTVGYLDTAQVEGPLEMVS